MGENTCDRCGDSYAFPVNRSMSLSYITYPHDESDVDLDDFTGLGLCGSCMDKFGEFMDGRELSMHGKGMF